MSIFYNCSGRAPVTFPAMKLKYVPRVLRSIAFGFLAMTFAHAQAPSATSDAATLSPIAFLTKHEWDAKLPDRPDGKKMKIHAQFTWSQNRQAIRISNQFVTDGNARPYIDGLYAWDPHQHAIAFWYVDAEGNLTKGTVKIEGGQLVHEFEETKGDGTSSAYVAKVTPDGERAWQNEIFARRGGELTSIVKVRYEIAN
jgi:dipeptidyl aminopeptidase/acylaminoacyl peptidase